MDTQFTSRYGDTMPSLLTMCHECEGMGFYPNMDDGPSGCVDPYSVEFVVCEHCRDGKVSRGASMLRLPGWIRNSAKFLYDTNLGFLRDCRQPGVSRIEHFKRTFRAVVLADLGPWRPGQRVTDERR
jgi:hypothetical protein